MTKDPLTYLYSRETLDAQPFVIRDICALVSRPEVRSLAGGWPDPAKFPIEAIRQIFDGLMAKHGDQLLQYGSTGGDSPNGGGQAIFRCSHQHAVPIYTAGTDGSSFPP